MLILQFAFLCISEFLCFMHLVVLLHHTFVIPCPSMLRGQNKNVASMTGFVVLWLSHNSIISFFFLVMGGWGWRLKGGGETVRAKFNQEVFVLRYSGTPLYGHLLNTDTPVLRTVSLVPTKTSHTFSLKLTRLIRTPVNTDNGNFSVPRVTNSYILSTPLYGHYLSVHCEFSLSRLFANLKTLDQGQIMTEFEELKPFYYKEKLNSLIAHFLCLCCSYRLCRKLKAFVQSKVTDFFKWLG